MKHNIKWWNLRKNQLKKKLSQLGQLTKPATYITRREQPNKKQIQYWRIHNPDHETEMLNDP